MKKQGVIPVAARLRTADQSPRRWNPHATGKSSLPPLPPRRATDPAGSARHARTRAGAADRRGRRRHPQQSAAAGTGRHDADPVLQPAPRLERHPGLHAVRADVQRRQRARSQRHRQPGQSARLSRRLRRPRFSRALVPRRHQGRGVLGLRQRRSLRLRQRLRHRRADHHADRGLRRPQRVLRARHPRPRAVSSRRVRLRHRWRWQRLRRRFRLHRLRGPCARAARQDLLRPRSRSRCQLCRHLPRRGRRLPEKPRPHDLELQLPLGAVLDLSDGAVRQLSGGAGVGRGFLEELVGTGADAHVRSLHRRRHQRGDPAVPAGR